MNRKTVYLKEKIKHFYMQIKSLVFRCVFMVAVVYKLFLLACRLLMCILIVDFVFISSVSRVSNSFFFFFCSHSLTLCVCIFEVTCNFRTPFDLCVDKRSIIHAYKTSPSPFVTFEIMRLYDQTALQISPGWLTWNVLMFCGGCLLVTFFFCSCLEETIIRCTHT